MEFSEAAWPPTPILAKISPGIKRRGIVDERKQNFDIRKQYNVVNSPSTLEAKQAELSDCKVKLISNISPRKQIPGVSDIKRNSNHVVLKDGSVVPKDIMKKKELTECFKAKDNNENNNDTIDAEEGDEIRDEIVNTEEVKEGNILTEGEQGDCVKKETAKENEVVVASSPENKRTFHIRSFSASPVRHLQVNMDERDHRVRKRDFFYHTDPVMHLKGEDREKGSRRDVGRSPITGDEVLDYPIRPLRKHSISPTRDILRGDFLDSTSVSSKSNLPRDDYCGKRIRQRIVAKRSDHFVPSGHHLYPSTEKPRLRLSTSANRMASLTSYQRGLQQNVSSTKQ